MKELGLQSVSDSIADDQNRSSSSSSSVVRLKTCLPECKLNEV